MPTRDEAAEALYRAGEEYRSSWVSNFTGSSNVAIALHQFWAALDTYRDATPTPLPAEVAWVLEAAARWYYAPNGNSALAAHDEMRDAIKAYCERVQFAQPEPLSTRLARLGKGAVVRTERVPHFDVLANCPERRCLFADAACFDFPRSVPYHDVTAILSESP